MKPKRYDIMWSDSYEGPQLALHVCNSYCDTATQHGYSLSEAKHRALFWWNQVSEDQLRKLAEAARHA